LIIEVCAGSYNDCITAEQAGGDRVELNSCLSSGGITPSAGMLTKILKDTKIPVIIMVRPRPGNFVYTENEISVMEKDIEFAVQHGAHGVAFGVLDNNGEINVNACKKLLSAAKGIETVFHRAFDLTPDPERALEICIDLGIKRILTSGQKKTAIEGAECIRRIINKAGGRIEILPAAGINPSNVEKIVKLTGCNQIHGSFSAKSHGEGRSDHPGSDYFKFGREQPATDLKTVMAMREIADSINKL